MTVFNIIATTIIARINTLQSVQLRFRPQSFREEIGCLKSLFARQGF
jgi:hypothetical protein